MRLKALLVALAVASAAWAPASHASTPRLGLGDDLAFLNSQEQARGSAFVVARRNGARYVRVTVDWSRVAPAGAAKPAGFDAADPESPGYNWGSIEDAVRSAAARKLKVVLTIVRAPAWAEGPGRPAGAPPGSWEPDPGELASFVRAAARRFSGFFPDPKDSGDGLTAPGASLAHVRYWQIWSEPNGGATLRGGDVVERYRAMLNEAAKGLKAVDPDNVVIAGGTSARAGAGIAPLVFWRALLRGSARFDVAAHDPVTGRNPAARLGRNDVGVATLGRLKRLLGRRKPLWLTRLAWDSAPPAARGISPFAQARFLVDALYRADRAGAAVVIWDGLQDRVSYLTGFPDIRSGLYLGSVSDLRHDAPKPALRAYRFPFRAHASGRRTRFWGLAPRAGRVSIQRRAGRVSAPMASSSHPAWRPRSGSPRR